MNLSIVSGITNYLVYTMSTEESQDFTELNSIIINATMFIFFCSIIQLIIFQIITKKKTITY